MTTLKHLKEKCLTILMDYTAAGRIDADIYSGRSQGTKNKEDYMLAKDVFLIPSVYLDTRGENIRTQQQANEYAKTLFREYCEENNLIEEI